MVRRLRLKCDGTRTQTRFCISSIKGRVHLNRRGRQFSRLLAGELCTSACRVCTVRASLCVLQSCDAYWLPTPFSCFHFTSPPVRHGVPSHFNWTIPLLCSVCVCLGKSSIWRAGVAILWVVGGWSVGKCGSPERQGRCWTDITVVSHRAKKFVALRNLQLGVPKTSSSSPVTSQASIDLFQPRLIVSSKVFQFVFFHFVYNSALFVGHPVVVQSRYDMIYFVSCNWVATRWQ